MKIYYLAQENFGCVVYADNEQAAFEIIKEITKESVEEELYDFLTSKMETGDIPDIERVRVFKDNLVTVDNGIIIDCVSGKQIRLTIQVD